MNNSSYLQEKLQSTLKTRPIPLNQGRCELQSIQQQQRLTPILDENFSLDSHEVGHIYGGSIDQRNSIHRGCEVAPSNKQVNQQRTLKNFSNIGFNQAQPLKAPKAVGFLNPKSIESIVGNRVLHSQVQSQDDIEIRLNKQRKKATTSLGRMSKGEGTSISTVRETAPLDRSTISALYQVDSHTIGQSLREGGSQHILLDFSQQQQSDGIQLSRKQMNHHPMSVSQKSVSPPRYNQAILGSRRPQPPYHQPNGMRRILANKNNACFSKHLVHNTIMKQDQMNPVMYLQENIQIRNNQNKHSFGSLNSLESIGGEVLPEISLPAGINQRKHAAREISATQISIAKDLSSYQTRTAMDIRKPKISRPNASDYGARRIQNPTSQHHNTTSTQLNILETPLTNYNLSDHQKLNHKPPGTAIAQKQSHGAKSLAKRHISNLQSIVASGGEPQNAKFMPTVIKPGPNTSHQKQRRSSVGTSSKKFDAGICTGSRTAQTLEAASAVTNAMQKSRKPSKTSRSIMEIVTKKRQRELKQEQQVLNEIMGVGTNKMGRANIRANANCSMSITTGSADRMNSKRVSIGSDLDNLKPTMRQKKSLNSPTNPQKKEITTKENGERRTNIEQNKTTQSDSDQGDIDIDVIQSKDFFRRKEIQSNMNRKLKEFYQRQQEESDVSFFTMAENAFLIRQQNELEGNSSGVQHAALESNPLFKRIIQQKLQNQEVQKRSVQFLPSSSKGLVEFNTEPIIEKNNKNLKTIQFQLNMLVSSGVQHEILPRFVGSGTLTKLDIVEGTYKLFKIETRKMHAPLKLFIFYKSKNAKDNNSPSLKTKKQESLVSSKSQLKQDEAPQSQDLTIFYSYTNPKPEESNCDGISKNPMNLTIETPGDERIFSREFLFLKVATVLGCQASLKLVFPKQDFLDAKIKKAQQQNESDKSGASGLKLSKNKIHKNVEYMISKLINEPRKHETFQEQLKEINIKKMQQQEMVANALQKRKEMSNNPESQQQRAGHQSQVKERRRQLDAENQKKRILQTVKWDIVRAKEKQMMAKLQRLKGFQLRNQQLITHIVLFQFVKKIYDDYYKESRKRYMQYRIFICANKIAFSLQKRILRKGKNKKIRERMQARDSLILQNTLMHEGATKRAHQCFLWFIRESAYLIYKRAKLRIMVQNVIRVQRAYKQVKFIRIVRRSLMDTAWEKFVEEQRKAAQLAEKNAKKQQKSGQSQGPNKTTSSKDVFESTQTSQTFQQSNQQTVLKLRQFELISQKNKNDMMDKYYQMRELDRSLQLMYKYEDLNELAEDIIVPYLDKRQETVQQIYELLVKLNLPNQVLLAELKDKGIMSTSRRLSRQITQDPKNSSDAFSTTSVSPLKSQNTKKLKNEQAAAATQQIAKQSTSNGIDNQKTFKIATSFLTDTQIASLTTYGLNRSNESNVERAGKMLPTKAELTLMLYKTYVDAEAEAKRIAREKAAAKKVNSKKKGQPATDSKEKKCQDDSEHTSKEAAKQEEHKQ